MTRLRSIATFFLFLGFIRTTASIGPIANNVEDLSDSELHRSMQGADSDSSVYILVIARILDTVVDRERFHNVIRPEFTKLLRAQKGVKLFRSFDVEFDTSNQATSNNTLVSLFHYRSAKARERVARELPSNEIAQEFVASVESQNIVLTPADEGRPRIRSIARTKNKILGVVIRNLTTYEDFDMEDYEQVRERFLDGISKVKGVRRSLSWTAPDLDILFNVYASSEVYRGITFTPEETIPPEALDDVQAYFTKYPGTRALFSVAREV